jgi:curved DNA-binding protein CbpA
VNLYDVLGVSSMATPAELREAHRRAVRSLHPDTRDPSFVAAEADVALRMVNEAWAVLGDPTRRSAYDEDLEFGRADADGEAWLQAPHGGARFPWWVVVLAVLLVIFVFTAYAGAPGGSGVR